MIRTVNELIPDEAGRIRLQAPAKINLMLSVHGRREDGFHALTSLVVPLEFGDSMELRVNGGQADCLSSDGVAVPLDASNLVLRAARLFREHSVRTECFDFRLQKRIPVGAGLGGGSSDAVAALLGMDALLQTRMDGEALRALAAALGSDCPFFVDGVPAIMRGRGELLEPLTAAATARLGGQRVLLFRPDFGVETGWAYGQFAARPGSYEAPAVAEARWQAFAGGGMVADLLHNGFEAVVGRKFLAIPCLLEQLRAHGYPCLMSGSGSVCFALVNSAAEAAAVKALCLSCWGEGIFWVETSFAGRMI